MGSMMLDPIVSDPKRERTSGWTWRVLRRIQAIAITTTNDQGFALRTEGPPLLELLQTWERAARRPSDNLERRDCSYV